jgi:hypothetical protein
MDNSAALHTFTFTKERLRRSFCIWMQIVVNNTMVRNKHCYLPVCDLFFFVFFLFLAHPVCDLLEEQGDGRHDAWHWQFYNWEFSWLVTVFFFSFLLSFFFDTNEGTCFSFLFCFFFFFKQRRRRTSCLKREKNTTQPRATERPVHLFCFPCTMGIFISNVICHCVILCSSSFSFFSFFSFLHKWTTLFETLFTLSNKY